MKACIPHLLIALLSMAACSDKEEHVPQPQGGLPVWTGGQTQLPDISGKWIIYQYTTIPNGTPQLLSDTLDFIGSNLYTYAGQTPCNHSLYAVVGAYKLNLQCTPWGSISGSVSATSLQTGQINGLPFTDTFNPNNKVWLWMRR
jgi:hypothetical protein